MSNPNANSNSNIYITFDQESEEGTESESESESESEEDSDGTAEDGEDSEEEEQEEFIPVESSRILSRIERENSGEGLICLSGVESGENSQGNEWNRGDIDGLFCPICMEAWTTTGDHRVCCLPCGHIFGFSCILKWLQQRATSRKCPLCNRKCALKDVRRLFASRVVAIDGEAEKRIRSLEAMCVSLEKKVRLFTRKRRKKKMYFNLVCFVMFHFMNLFDLIERKKFVECYLSNKEAEWKKREAVLQQELHQLKGENYIASLQSKYGDYTSTHPDFDPQSWSQAIGGVETTRKHVYGFGNRPKTRHIFPSSNSCEQNTSESATYSPCDPYISQRVVASTQVPETIYEIMMMKIDGLTQAVGNFLQMMLQFQQQLLMQQRQMRHLQQQQQQMLSQQSHMQSQQLSMQSQPQAMESPHQLMQSQQQILFPSQQQFQQQMEFHQRMEVQIQQMQQQFQFPRVGGSGVEPSGSGGSDLQ